MACNQLSTIPIEVLEKIISLASKEAILSAHLSYNRSPLCIHHNNSVTITTKDKVVKYLFSSHCGAEQVEDILHAIGLLLDKGAEATPQVLMIICKVGQIVGSYQVFIIYSFSLTSIAFTEASVLVYTT
jgi:hypothetical protein